MSREDGSAGPGGAAAPTLLQLQLPDPGLLRADGGGVPGVGGAGVGAAEGEEGAEGPAGLRALCEACERLYPDQRNPLQVTARLKYWLGGPDPLDYVSMYWSAGSAELRVPPHWHYVSFGLSDLHGDGRVHPPPAHPAHPPPDACSGYGFELTFRLAAPERAAPPTWPAALLQSLARYVFRSGNRVCPGDHVSWHAALDGAGGRVRHMLAARDAALPPARTRNGSVQFVQLVGATGRELRAAQRHTGSGVLELMAQDPRCGGAWLVTDMGRRASCAGLGALRAPGCDLAGVSTRLRWAEWAPAASAAPAGAAPAPDEQLSPSLEEEIKCVLQRGLHGLPCMSTDSGSAGAGSEARMSTDSFSMSSVERALSELAGAAPLQAALAGGLRTLRGVHVVFDAEGGRLLPLALTGRVLQARHFTWRCASGARAVTFLSERVGGAFVSPRRPYAASAHGWLQVLLDERLARDMAARTAALPDAADSESEEEGGGARAGGGAALPLTLEWPRHRIKITVLSPHQELP